MYHLHDELPDKDTLHETAVSEFERNVKVLNMAFEAYIHTSITPYKSANKYYDLW
jgi:hypothetical protein